MRAALLILAVLLSGLLFSAFPAKHAPTPQPLATTSAPAAAAASESALPSPQSVYEWYQVERVVDGDTLVVNREGVSTKLRLIGLDTPETVDPRKPVQCFGIEASNEAKRLLAGARVRLEYDQSQGLLDKYGRTLAYVFLTDGTLFNEYMIASGFGHEYTYRLPYEYQSEFEAAERKARDEKRGLWADGACAGNTD